ncbi:MULTISPECIES: SGNH/GDSL hydrolase family protein [unclassified Streptomyces]|uniref:SGNH/GDSL hydrolase family protein n=1 Tax=unclassified Streptomyces TaxID=2593676 RepID=UPI0006FE6AFC|nr:MULTISPECIES: SGNH/GDSL hydrolase family protein [unclassified Streptomyces]KQX57858.1 G-D-S-L family lipolytic protein [Streptomyces sp. Root1304]KRA78742.1 G-D-S-L family lipolytic protein [Streptomyces sp. Root66D1]
MSSHPHHPPRSHHPLRVLLPLLALAAATTLTACGTDAGAHARGAPADGSWRGAWAASPQPPGPGNWSQQGFTDHTLRQTVRVTAGGTRLRIELSNRYGTTPLHLTGATVARATAPTPTGTAGPGSVEPGSVEPGSVRRLTFGPGGDTAATVPRGGTVLSEAADLPVAPFARVTVTLHLAGPTGPATSHLLATATSHRAKGDRLADTDGSAFTEHGTSWYYLSGIEVSGGARAERPGAVVTFGDSLTDGAGATTDADNRYPDELAERLAAAGRPRAVLNHGIGGNRVVRDGGVFGEQALDRFAPDVLAERGVSTVLVLEGINDLGGRRHADVTVDELIEGHRTLIREARARGLKVVGATLTPVKGSVYDTPATEAERDAFNHWIRTAEGADAYDAYVDFDRALADPADPDRMLPAYDSGDHLHPSDAGYRAMAEAIDLDRL